MEKCFVPKHFSYPDSTQSHWRAVLSTAIDVCLVHTDQIGELCENYGLDALDEIVTLWGLTNLELDDLASLLNVRALESRPLFRDAGHRRVLVLWTNEFVGRLGELEAGQRVEAANLLSNSLEARAEAALENMVELCRKALTLDLRVLQIIGL